MDLVSFARGPALAVALTIFCVGVTWRIAAFVLLRTHRRYSVPRNSFMKSALGGIIAMGSRSWPHPEFIPRTGAGEALGYAYHLGLFIVIGLSAAHIAFFRALFGVSWPALPSGVITIASVLTFTLLLAVLFRRLTHPVLRLLSNFDDYFSWFITTLVVVTGLMATAHVGGAYPTLLGLHILSFDALLIWFPFGKLMHAFYLFPSRAINAALLSRKGAAS
jgi:nitrate reductase gamma subunit